jgi:hypothetical protein
MTTQQEPEAIAANEIALKYGMPTDFEMFLILLKLAYLQGSREGAQHIAERLQVAFEKPI